MMVLTLLTKQIDGEFTVYWKTGLRRGGELKVDLGEQYDKLPEQQKPIAAELYAIHHLLSVKEVMGSNRSGNGLQIRVSKGAITAVRLRNLDRSEVLKPRSLRYNSHYLDSYFTNWGQA